MAHFQQMEFVRTVKKHHPRFFEGARVIEIGSADINGSIRQAFSRCDYVGVDVVPGKGVDIVQSGHALDLPDASFDVAISCECFEHNEFWRETFVNMVRMLRPGGLLIFTCAGIGRSEHGTARAGDPVFTTADDDYYRNLTRRDVERGVGLGPLFVWYEFFTNVYFKDLYFVGMRANGTKESVDNGALRRDVRRIAFDRPVPWWRHAGVHLEWGYRATLARVLGERLYHDLNHFRRRNRRNRRKVAS